MGKDDTVKTLGLACRASAIFQTPLGWSGVVVSDNGVCGVVLPEEDKHAVEQALLDSRLGSEMVGHEAQATRCAGLRDGAAEQLRAYFSGLRRDFELPLDLSRATDFQRAVWKAAGKIPYGETRSYGWIAKKIGKPLAMRAVGQALGANPVPVIIPCHRIISAAGKPGGFTGGVAMKLRLLDLEQQCLTYKQ